jgi:hypothetical protein
LSGNRSVSFYWALTGIFGGLQFIMTVFPFSPEIGGGGVLSVGLISAPIIGFLLGPFYGVVAVLVGTLLGLLANPATQILWLFTVIPPTLSALASALLRIGRVEVVSALLLIGILGFILGPLGTFVPYFPWFQLVCIVLCLLFVIPPLSIRISAAINMRPGTSRELQIVGIWLVCLISILVDHSIGSAIGGIYFTAIGYDMGLLTGYFTLTQYVYPVERLLASVVATLILLPVATIASSSHFDLPLPLGQDEDWSDKWKPLTSEN